MDSFLFSVFVSKVNGLASIDDVQKIRVLLFLRNVFNTKGVDTKVPKEK